MEIYRRIFHFYEDLPLFTDKVVKAKKSRNDFGRPWNGVWRLAISFRNIKMLLWILKSQSFYFFSCRMVPLPIEIIYFRTIIVIHRISWTMLHGSGSLWLVCPKNYPSFWQPKSGPMQFVSENRFNIIE